MSKQALADFIRANVPISDQTLAEILPHYEPRVLRKNEFLLHEGEISNQYFYLETGIMRAFTLDTDGHEVTTFFYAPNQLVFEPASFFMRAVSDESLQAVTDCTGYALTPDKLNALFHAVPEFREFGRKMLVRGFVAFKQRALGLINKSAEERYRHLLATHRELFQHAQLRHIASYLGITDTSLSRIRKGNVRKLV